LHYLTPWNLLYWSGGENCFNEYNLQHHDRETCNVCINRYSYYLPFVLFSHIMVDFFKYYKNEYILMYNIYDDWLFLFLRDWLPTMTFVLFIIAIIYIYTTKELE